MVWDRFVGCSSIHLPYLTLPYPNKGKVKYLALFLFPFLPLPHKKSLQATPSGRCPSEFSNLNPPLPKLPPTSHNASQRPTPSFPFPPPNHHGPPLPPHTQPQPPAPLAPFANANLPITKPLKPFAYDHAKPCTESYSRDFRAAVAAAAGG